MARMVSTVQNIAIDCADAYELARFWSRVTDGPLDPESEPGGEFAAVHMPDGTTLFFHTVPEPKEIKNRLHLCLRPKTSRDPEVEWLLEIGATWVSDHRKPDGTGWAVLADPQGNEFCVLRSTADRAVTP